MDKKGFMNIQLFAVNSQSIVSQANTSNKDTLAESWGWVLENHAKKTITGVLKKTELSGSLESGVMNAKRFANSEAKAYGTARTASAAEKVKALNVPVPIDDNKEWLEEVEQLDIATYGVDGLISRRTQNQLDSINRYFERRFFNTAFLKGSIIALSGATISAKLEGAIVTLEKLQNDFVDGIDREKMAMILDTATYSEMRQYINTIQNANIDSSVGEFGRFNGVLVFSSHRLPATVDMVLMVRGESVAQPISPVLYPMKQIELSKAWAFGAFTDSSTTAVCPDLIFIAGTIGTIAADKATSTAAAAGETTKTVITVTEPKADPANDFYWLSGASAVAAPAYGTAVGETWTKLVLTTNAQKITTDAHTKIRVAEADASGRIIKVSGEITIVNGE